MANILDEKRKKRLKRIFYARALVLLLSLLLFATIFASVVFLAINAMLHNELDWAKERLSAPSYGKSTAQDAYNEDAMLKIAQKLQDAQSESYADILQGVVSLMAESGVTPSNISVDLNEQDNSVSINADASTDKKEKIIYLMDLIKKSDKIYDLDIDSVINSLKKSVDGKYDFNLNLKYKSYDN